MNNILIKYFFKTEDSDREADISNGTNEDFNKEGDKRKNILDDDNLEDLFNDNDEDDKKKKQEEKPIKDLYPKNSLKKLFLPLSMKEILKRLKKR